MPNLKFALRMLFKTPFVTTMAILSLALGIGANAGVYSMYDQIMLRPIPARDPGALVNLSSPGFKNGSVSTNAAGNSTNVFSYPMFRDLEKTQQVFEGIAAHRIFSGNFAIRKQTLTGEGLLISGTYFQLLGLHPTLGRFISPEDDRTVGESPVAVLSHAFWQSRLGADPTVVGETLVLNGQALTIIGVAPKGFNGTTLGSNLFVFVPITMREQMQPGMRKGTYAARNVYWAYLFARLKPGVSIDQARVSLNGQYHAIINDVEAPLLTTLSEQQMAQFRGKQIGMADGARGQSTVMTEARTPLLLLISVTAFVLLIACANIANLLLARSGARAGEMAVRLSIGAGRRHLIMQLLVESCLLALFGGAAGLLVAKWTLDAVSSLLPSDAGVIFQTTIDVPVLIFSAVLALATGLVFGLFPAWQSTRLNLVTMLKSQSGQSSGGRAAARFRTSLATAQVALSMALLVSAGLFLRSLYNVTHVDVGMNIEKVVTFSTSPGLNGYSIERSRQLFDQIEQELKQFPGAQLITSAIIPVLDGSNSSTNVTVEGFRTDPDTNTDANYNFVGADYFHTLEMPMLAGRDFTATDGSGAPKVVVVNEAFVKKFNMGSDAIGKHIGSGNTKTPDMEIVGVARNAKYADVKDPIPPQFFRPHRQVEDTRSLVFYVRVAGDPEDFVSNIPKMMAKLDSTLPVTDLRTLTQQFRENVFLDRMMSILAGAFATLATLLAAIGLYGVLAYTVMQRTKEIGVRMALGATPSRVRFMVVRQVGWMTIVGCVIGSAAAIALGQLAQSILFELQGSDPLVLAGAALALAAVALAAGAIPAHRASHVDPMRALRYE